MKKKRSNTLDTHECLYTHYFSLHTCRRTYGTAARFPPFRPMHASSSGGSKRKAVFGSACLTYVTYVRAGEGGTHSLYVWYFPRFPFIYFFSVGNGKVVPCAFFSCLWMDLRAREIEWMRGKEGKCPLFSANTHGGVRSPPLLPLPSRL